MVNPFPFYQNKYTYARGKEDLKPSYTYNAELGYTFKNNLNISAFYSYSDDVFFSGCRFRSGNEYQFFPVG